MSAWQAHGELHPLRFFERGTEAYKDVDAVVDVVGRSGIASKVARLKPVAVIKG